MIPILVCGAAGRMGEHVIQAVVASAELSLAGAVDRPDHPRQGQEIVPGIKLGSSLEEELDAARIAIDFSVPEATLELVAAATRAGAGLVIGTTGFAEAGLATIREASKRIPIVMAANFSLGINVLLDLVRQAAARLEGYEVEILELHHSRKVDAPSGTALRLARAAAEARGQELAAHAVYHREGETGTRPAGAIGLQSLRAGDSVGEHTVYLAGPGERLELSHRALSRANFASGAARAAAWLDGRAPGLYEMSEVLAP